MASLIFIIFLFLVSIAWIPVVQTGTNSRLFDYIQNVSSVLAPPICAVFLCAIFIPRTTEPLTGLTFWSNERSNDDALDTYRRNANGDVIKKNNKGYENKSYVVDDNLMGSTKLKQQEDEQSLDMNYPPKKRNFCVKMGMWICGIEKLKDSNTSTESMGVDMSVAENRYWRFSNNLNAILLLIFALFITIFFSGIDFGY
ncbi:hypothetical protein SNEBB_011289 [Seison nebaliae]|nr:hypothetical protein SNEBB_011289 [Seison nebaliae]